MTSMRRVLVVQRQLEHYRIPLFEALKKEMLRHDCELRLAYGRPDPARGTAPHRQKIDWATRLPTAYLFGGRLCLQPFAHLLDGVDAVVVAAENKLINNLSAQFFPHKCKVVLWGHGANLQNRDDTLRERFKRRVARQADWWLGYSEISRPLIARSGFPAHRVTILNNAIDTVALAAMRCKSTPESQRAMRQNLGLQGTRIGLFMGSLYRYKRISFLLSSALAIRSRVPDFEFLLLGDGPDSTIVQQFCVEHKWAHYLGAVIGPEKADAMALCRIMLNPGLVGLSILDSFVFSLPMLTTDCGLHSPEIAYMNNGVNGIMTRNNQEDYVNAAVKLLTDEPATQSLRIGCAGSALDYTLEKMAAKFAQGVASCLDAPTWRSAIGAKPAAVTKTAIAPSKYRCVAIVTNIVPIYRYPVYAALQQLSSFRFQIFVTVPLAQSCTEARESLPIKHSLSINLLRTTQHRSGATQQEPLSIPIALIWDLVKYRPDIIISGDLGLRSFVCWCLATSFGARFVLSSEEIASSAAGRTALQQYLRRFLVKRATACLAWGEAAETYLKSIGVRANCIFRCAQAIDNESWLRQADALDRDSERVALGFRGTVFLLVGRALRRKGFQNFLEAWGRLSEQEHAKISAVIVGDGDFLSDLKHQAAAASLRNVRFVGAQSPDQLARYYSAADVFVIPSLEDVWGLVVNEAMCFGLPILASQFAGASQSLVAGSTIGRLFNPADIDEFATRLLEWAESPPPMSRAKCRQILAQQTFDRSVESINALITHITSERAENGA